MSRRVDQAWRRLAAQRPSGYMNEDETEAPPWIPPGDTISPDESREESKRASRRRVLVAAGTTAVAAAGAAFLVRDVYSPTETVSAPPLLKFEPATHSGSTTELLHSLADRARNQPDPSGSGSVIYSRRRTWDFSTSVDPNGNTLGSGLSERIVETWVEPDGSGRRANREKEPPHGAEPIAMQHQYSTGFAYDHTSNPSPDVLKSRLLHAGHDWNAVEWFEAADSKWSGYLQEPRFASAFLQALATKSGISIEGRTTDRAGRNAVAISTESSKPGRWFPKQRLLLLFDPQRGLPIATEVVALSADTSAINVSLDTPATVSYMQWKRHARVSDIEARP